MNIIDYPIEKVLGRALDRKYYETVVRNLCGEKISQQRLWACGKASSCQALCGQQLLSIGFTGTQEPTREGYRVTHLFAQVSAALGYCVVSGCAYGVDVAAIVGVLSFSEFTRVITGSPAQKSIRQVIALVSGIRSRSPQSLYIDRGVLTGSGVYLSFFGDDAPMCYQLLSPVNRLIVDLCDIVVVTEAGNRGAFDMINWAIESGKPVLAIDWGEKSSSPVRSGCNIFRALTRPKPNLSELEELLSPYWHYATEDYDFTCAHPTKRATEVSSGGFDNATGYKTARDLVRHLITRLSEYQDTKGVSQIQLIPCEVVMPPHNGDQRERIEKAKIIKKILQAEILKTTPGLP